MACPLVGAGGLRQSEQQIELEKILSIQSIKQTFVLKAYDKNFLSTQFERKMLFLI